MRVAVILPSRGLIFSQTAEEILANFKEIPHKIYFAHKLPIPDCFKYPTVRAMEDPENTHFWFVEDDMILPPNVLQNMLFQHKPVVTMDYPVSKQGQGAVFRDGDKNVIFCGTGCLLVERSVLEKVGAPYWRSDVKWNIANYGTHIRMTANPNGTFDNYGLHDVNFGVKLIQNNIPITVLEGTLGQRKLIELGKTGTNNGAHKIEEWKIVKKDYLLKKIKSWDVVKYGSLVSVVTPTGTIETSKSHAKTLINKGLGVASPKRKLVIDMNGIKI